MAKKKILKDFLPFTQASKNKNILQDKEVAFELHDPREFLADKANIIKGIIQCLTDNNPTGVVNMLDAYRSASGKKVITFHSEGGTTFTPTQIKALTASARMITKILHPPKPVKKRVQKQVAKIATKKRRAPTATHQRPVLRAAGKKRSA